jgi:predicted dehydrogenase
VIRYGLIGAGGVGRKRAACLKPGQLISVCDTEAGRAESLIAAVGQGCVVNRPEEIFRDPAIDAVLVSTRHDSLAILALGAMQAGKSVLVEKPAARHAAELAPLLEAEPTCGVRVRVGYNHRFHPALQKAREIVDAGELGPLMFVRGRYGHGGRLGYETEWRAQKEISGGGELIDQGVHLIDLARWFLGDFARVRGTTSTLFWDMPVEDNAFLELQTGGGQVAWLHASCSEWKNLFSFEIYGRAGKLQIDGLGGSYGPERLTHYRMSPAMGPPESETHEFPGGDSSWQRELEAFERDIETGTPPSPGLADALAALKIVEEIYKSAGPSVTTSSLKFQQDDMKRMKDKKGK